MSEETNYIQTPQADWRGKEYATGRMRYITLLKTTTKPKVLQQEWAVDWGNNMGDMVSTQWVNVPTVAVDNEEQMND